jgi:predicted nucleic acid-binding protein
VIDANIFVKLLIKEEYSEYAYLVRDAYISGDAEILVPSLFNYEVLNAVRYSKTYSSMELEEVPGFIDDYGFTSFEMSGKFSSEVVRIALKYKIAVYDASYIALASITGSVLYTADQPLIDAVKLNFVKHIKGYRP